MAVQNAQIAPDRAEITRDIAYMTARWAELNAPVWLEVRAFREGSHPQTAKFRPSWISDAVDWIADMNQRGYNIYAVRNPVSDAIGGRSATDADIAASFFLWADCDDPAAAGNVHRFDGPKWSAAVTTGTAPCIRVHTY